MFAAAPGHLGSPTPPRPTTNRPKRYRRLVLLATFCGMRFGELAALTRADVDAEEAGS